MTEMNEEDLRKLGSYFTELGMKPQLDSAEQFKEWMEKQGPSATATVKKEPSAYREEQHLTIDRIPRISNFWGTTDSKDATSYDLWRYEVECLLNEGRYSREVIAEAIRRSLKGEAAKLAMRMGPKAVIAELLHKLDGRYGVVMTESSLLTHFYTTVQKDSEDVTTWSVRIEDIIQQVQQKGLISRGTMTEMLRSKLWSGLRDEQLRQATRHKYDTIKDFDELVIAIRCVESETKGFANDKKKAKAQVLQQNKEGNRDDKTQEMFRSLERRLDSLEKDIKEIKSRDFSRREDSGDQQKYQPLYSGRGRGRGGRRGRGSGRQQEARRAESSSKQSEEKKDDVVCYRCGQKGHISLGCRVRTDHLRNLNGKSPMLRDEH